MSMRSLLLALLFAAFSATAALAAGGGWSITSYPSAGERASGTQGPTANAGTTGLVIRLTSIQASLAASGSIQAPLRVIIRDGQQGTGTIIWSAAVTALANTVAGIFITGLDIRSSVGSSLAVEFSATGATNAQQSINAQGDMVPVGYNVGAP